MKKAALSVLLAGLALTSCAAPAPSTIPPAAAHDEHDEDEHYPDIPAMTWDAADEQAAKDAAVKAMTLYARPGLEERQWITDLAPLLAPDYLADAQYINPARIPVTGLKGGPVLVREAGDPLTVQAVFETNTGKWAVLLHRAGQADPWLVHAIAPKEGQ